jgi:hypothetical protein
MLQSFTIKRQLSDDDYRTLLKTNLNGGLSHEQKSISTHRSCPDNNGCFQ